MIRKLTMILIALALLFLVACGEAEQNGSVEENSSDGLLSGGREQSESVQENNSDYLPSWVMNMFTEEQLSSGEMLTVLTSADYQSYSTIADLIESAASDVIKAEVLDERVEWLNFDMPIPEDRWGDIWYDINDVEEFVPHYEPHTVNRLRVLEVFKGDSEVGDIVEVGQRGGQTGNFNFANRELMVFEIGEVLLFVLSDPNLDEGRDPSVTLPLIMVNPWQTVYRIGSARGEEVLEGFCDSPVAFTVTMDELVNAIDE